MSACPAFVYLCESGRREREGGEGKWKEEGAPIHTPMIKFSDC